MIPGSNILNLAFRAITRQSVSYYQDIGRTTNVNGIDVTNYASPVIVTGSLQAVPLNDYQMMGLDFAKNYVTLYTDTPMIGVERDVSGDLFTFNGRVYQVRGTTDWLGMDGWNAVSAVQVDFGLPDTDDYVVNPAGMYWVTPAGDFVVTPR